MRDDRTNYGLLSYEELLPLLGDVIQGADKRLVNAASIDLTLGRWALKERKAFYTVRLKDRAPLQMEKVSTEYGLTLLPGQFVLCETQQKFYLPDDLAAEYKLKSSMARIGLNHMLAGWCDPGWNGSVLTMELKNCSQYHAIELHEGDAIGQMVFYRVSRVPKGNSYRARGTYNNHESVTGPKPRRVVEVVK